MDVNEAPPRPRPAAPAPSELPSFRSDICATLPTAVQAQIVALERANMQALGLEANGDAACDVEALLKRWDATAHVAMAPGGELLGYSINTTEQRGKKRFVYGSTWRRARRARASAARSSSSSKAAA